MPHERMNTPAVPQAKELQAPASWRTADFISDLHLHESEPETFAAWQRYLQATPADAVFILGDLFEAWVGDDVVSTHDDAPNAVAANFETRCADVLREASQRLSLYFMHGNRDFLVGRSLMESVHATLLDDPTVLVFPPDDFTRSGKRWLLSHGDELCLDDTDYQQFRLQVRSDAWQRAFLAKPLAGRQQIARGLRAQSEARKQSGAEYADLDAAAVRRWLDSTHATALIHGHTHRPAVHELGDGRQRIVLSDWDLAATPARAEVLRLTAQGFERIALP
ncbi:MAG: UDP-2,3-diacylglucosamine diphosphatase [Comamonadaceae bacterium]|nr:MAG: UDP-2,3-diacylglucosamine diphosphatase [Comamonadaceae bacterium]